MPKKVFSKNHPVERIVGVADATLNTIDTVERTIQSTVAPLRKNVLKRYPTVFLLAVTFGITATAFGVEQLMSQSAFLMDRPYLIVAIGITILVLTGTAYRKSN